MKLLFDQNISFRIIKKISDIFPEAKQIRELGLENNTDRQIWDFAKENEFAIVTYDTDFFDLSNLFGIPPKIIWLRTGNRKTSDLAELILSRSEIIIEFLRNPSYKELACLEIDEEA
jgi:predicted nuclease of predicted toxin-antitoxin system